ncbi:efflux RND transporter periplasmic adaptor subunit [Mucilaginibacter sp. CAU 1740]|uniref:efflux RND transporter periplasmic adaptor subunit n=1 Tax=Mucilaginibacter sp. CAU 1740 TaxID=3140365 RepID=UPI00325BD78D
MQIPNKATLTHSLIYGVLGAAMFMLPACSSNQQQGGGAAGAQAPQSFPAFKVVTQNATINDDYPATIQGEQNIEIRPKIDGYIDAILIDEGAAVKKGQLLFRISAPQYAQDVNNASAAISSAEADLSAAELQVKKTKPLVEKDIISHYELESAEYTLKARQAALKQAKANLANAKINQAYTNVTSPVNGVVGTIPYKLGSLITSTTQQPLTTISNIGKVYAYFSLNEKQLLDFSRQHKGSTLDAKLKSMPKVSLLLSDGSEYPEKGSIETVSGLLNTTTGSASFRAGFANPLGLIRSGGSATIRIPEALKDALLVPQKATYELQGKRFVYVVDASGKAKSTEVQTMSAPTGQYFVVTGGIKAGDTLILDGIGSLQDGMQVKPEITETGKVYHDIN